MDSNKSLDVIKSDIAALLCDVQTKHSGVYTPRDTRLDQRKLFSRMTREGIGLITKTLPRLAKAFDRALTGEVSLDSTGWCKSPGSQLPRFLGGLFKSVFTLDGWVLPTPCVACIATIRQVLGLWYKYELPYDRTQEQEVIEQFERTDADLLDISLRLSHLASDGYPDSPRFGQSFDWPVDKRIIRSARRRLRRLFATFDPRDIVPSHGPGAVSTGERLWEKWTFTNVPQRITESYPLDEYFYTSLSHVADDLDGLRSITSNESSAKVCLVPKDSRGPRLISCEPLEFQWVQQGLSRAIVKRVESHPLTRWNVNFTNQQPNQFGALLGSSTGKYATLDLKEASDRISVGLVHLLFPEPILGYLMNCRSLSTVLPDGRTINLNKFAPMGSALCFPILALSVWAILSAAAPDANTRESILVYGDDVIVPTTFVENAIKHLEAFGLLVNRAKSCTKGFFRESCGTDAFAGVRVTPVRFRTVWSSSRCPHVYASWIAYANQMYERRFFNLYWNIVNRLLKVYGPIPDKSINPGGPFLVEVPATQLPKVKRVNKSLQRLEYKVWTLRSPPVKKEIEGWKMLLRFFTEGSSSSTTSRQLKSDSRRSSYEMVEKTSFQVRAYTKRDTVKLVKRWR